MAEYFNEFLLLPWWFTIPLVAVYLSLLVYMICLLWHKNNDTINNYET